MSDQDQDPKVTELSYPDSNLKLVLRSQLGILRESPSWCMLHITISYSTPGEKNSPELVLGIMRLKCKVLYILF